MEIQGLHHSKKQRLRGDRKCPLEIDKLSGTPYILSPSQKLHKAQSWSKCCIIRNSEINFCWIKKRYFCWITKRHFCWITKNGILVVKATKKVELGDWTNRSSAQQEQALHTRHLHQSPTLISSSKHLKNSSKHHPETTWRFLGPFISIC